MSKIIGNIVEIFSATKDTKSKSRPIVQSLNLIKDYGIENDKFAGKDLDKTVMIVGIKSYEIARDNGIKLEYGSLGENILLDFDPHNYKVGDIFDIENTKIKITQICTVCSHLSRFDKKLPKLLNMHRGLYCKILNNGIIKNKMQVSVKEIK
ncbi:MOSC domain-containing protein [Malaciobacter molluscorum]|uniref:MOSC domain-containing protein n=1 Tax=Malaciobacter molluscorum TaxID=1032072 RepID=UPI00100BD87E|nr:MOSC domain-containing protein [Malaciobacter molluscorum]RXJ94595.1 MOSC domain-containing protein [Malaciobacter molluscorum]